MPYLIAIDIGGTFTDLVACDIDTGASPTPRARRPMSELGDAIFDCIRKAAIDARDASFVKHGTTLVINALLQRTGAKTALLTTTGFRDVLEIGRGNRTQPFNLRFHRAPPLVPRELRFEIDRAHRRRRSRCARRSRSTNSRRSPIACGTHKVEALAISFLNSYLDARARTGRSVGDAPIAARTCSSPPAPN